MKKQTKKELLFFATVFFGILMIGIIGGLVMALLNNTGGSESAPVFVGFQHYIRLLIHDPILGKALGNTILLSTLPVVSAVLIAYLLSVISHKLPRMVIYILFGIIAILSVGAVAIYSIMVVSGDGYGVLNTMLLKLKLIQQPIGFDVSSVKIITWIFGILAFWAALGICILFFTAAKLDFFTGIKRIGVIMTEMLITVCLSASICEAATQWIGYPATDYAVHTITSHVNDYSAVTRNGSVLPIVGIIWKAELAVLMTLGLWGVDKLRNFLKNRLFS
ncbi:MAG: hypothetical protein PUB00_01765 [Clostridiales bacterium]|nr:hypothetical protein [Clostridiales bacterium]